VLSILSLLLSLPGFLDLLISGIREGGTILRGEFKNIHLESVIENDCLGRNGNGNVVQRMKISNRE
jgi:hypothetical protein